MNGSLTTVWRQLPAFLCMGILALLMGCGASKTKKYPTPDQFDLNTPYKMQLSQDLDEISGIYFYAKDTTAFAIVDEDGWLYKIFLKRNGAIQKWKFGKNHDYEDLELIDSSFYVLSSSGDITRINFSSTDSLSTQIFKFPGSGSNEFESMYYDSAAGNINILCKDCDADDKSSLSTWVFSIADGTYSLSPVLINVSPVAEALGENKVRFKPSATALNPVTEELYMISAINKVLAIAGKDGVITKVYKLNPTLFRQPEGMAFTPSGDLLISNELGDGNTATILVFKNKNTRK